MEPGLQVGRDGECLVAGLLPMGSDQARSGSMGPLPPFKPPAGGAKGVSCIAFWVAA